MALDGVGGIRAELGARATGWVDVDGVPNWQLPVVIVRGSRPGPTLAITAGVHAAEYAPIEALRQFVFSVDPRKLVGTIAAVLLVNVPGFPVRSIYVNPVDGKNVNNCFPGSQSGSPSERIAAFLMSEVILQADAFVDLHCGDMVEAAIPFSLWTRTGNAEVDTKSERMATAYGAPLIFDAILDQTRGMPRAEAAAQGIPSMVGTAGQQGICDAESVGLLVNGATNVLRVLGMLEGPQARTSPRKIGQILAIRASESGCFHANVTLGATVQSGQVVGQVRDIFGETRQEVVSPKSGLVMCMLTGLAVNKGEVLVEVGG